MVSLCSFAVATGASLVLDRDDWRWLSVVLYGGGAILTVWGLVRRDAEKRARRGVLDPFNIPGDE
jgi:hypothetical protein